MECEEDEVEGRGAGGEFDGDFDGDDDGDGDDQSLAAGEEEEEEKGDVDGREDYDFGREKGGAVDGARDVRAFGTVLVEMILK